MENIPVCITMASPKTKTFVMQISKINRTLIIVVVICLNAYAIIEAIVYENFIGILLAIGSLVAMAYCVHLMKKLKEIEAKEEG